MTLFGEIVEKIFAIFGVGIIALILYFFIYALVDGESKSFKASLFLWLIRRFLILMWLLICVSVGGEMWVKIAGAENVPQWAVMLFQTHEKGESQCLAN